MANLSSYPHYQINVEDRSIFEAIASEILPLHRPVYPMKCQKGPIGVPVWCPTITEARKVFGAETFNVLNSTYYSPSSEFLNNTFINNGAFIVRLADADVAETSWAILEVSSKPVDVVQYQKDANGNIIRDTEGDPVPEDDGGGGSVTEPGLELNWQVRTALEVGEDFDDLQIRTVVEGADTVTYYPIMSFKANSPGAWGNDTGFKFYMDIDENGEDKVARVNARYFSMSPVEKEYNASTVDPIRDKYNNIFNSFVLKPDTIDESIASFVSAKEVLENAYSEGDGLPYTIKVYAENAYTLGEAIKAVEVNRNGDNVGVDTWATEEITDGWMADIVSATDLENKPYDHVVIGTTGDVMTSAVVHYLAEGTDGDITDTAIEALYRNFLELDINPDIVDRARYPFTHLFDVGWSIDTKYAMCDFLAVRDDIKLVMSTQRVTDVGGEATLNTQAIDESIGSAVRSRALLIPESIIKGTECFRAMIFQQAGYVHSLYAGIIPATLWYAQKLALYHNVDYMKGAPEGLPFSDIDIFKEWNWTPSAESMRERSWNTGLNYFQYYNMTQLHYASLRTIYRYDTSVLTIDDFSNALIYTKHEIRQSWAVFAGVTRPAGVLRSQVTQDLSLRLDRLYNNRYTFTVTVYQTEEEAQLGYVHHVRVVITSPAQNRVWEVDLVCQRENFEG